MLVSCFVIWLGIFIPCSHEVILGFNNLPGRKVGTILFKNTAASTEIAEISAQTHLELEQKCLAALAVASNVSIVLQELL